MVLNSSLSFVGANKPYTELKYVFKGVDKQKIAQILLVTPPLIAGILVHKSS